MANEKSPYPLEGILEVMKPCRINKDNPNHVSKLNSIMSNGSSYAAEEKIDGCHYVMIENRFFSTRISVKTGVPVEKTANLPHLAEAFKTLDMNGLILDGEITMPGGKSQDVITITGCLPDLAVDKQVEGKYLHYTVFDLLRAPKGNWTADLHWAARRQLLEELFSYIDSPYIHLSKVVYKDKRQFLDYILDQGGEGIVLKHIEATYHPGKRTMWNWVKVKVESTDDVVIMGFEPPTKEYTGKEVKSWPYWSLGEDDMDCPVTRYYHLDWIGAVVIGKYKEDGELVKLGTCSGMDDSTRADMTAHPEKYVGKVAQIRLMEKTPDGAYRHPAFVSLHADKNAKECVLSD